MQQTFLTLITMCCLVGFATNLTTALAKPNKKTSLMMKTLVKISADILPENLTLSNDVSTQDFKGAQGAGKIKENSTETSAFKSTSFPMEIREVTTSLTPTKREIKLNARQKMIMNQIVAVYALNDVKDPVCKNHTLEYKRALRDFEPWALKSSVVFCRNMKFLTFRISVFDSSSKLEAGIFVGNLMEYGSFRQCVEIYAHSNSGPIRGQHCTLKVTPNDDLLRYILSYRNVSRRRFKKVRKLMLGASLSWSVCIPDSCPSKEVLSHFNKTILLVTEGLTLNVSLGDYDCYKITEDEPPLSQTEWMVIFMFMTLGVITLICTIIDVRTRLSDAPKNQLMIMFSTFSNVKKLLAVRTEKQPLDCLNGIRVLSMCYVVVGHRYVLSMFFPLINALEIMDWVMYYTSTTIIGGTVCVDTFFMISGLLVTYMFFEHMSKGLKFNLPLFLLHRWLRVTPALMVIALIHATLIHHLGSGPLWKKTVRSLEKPCQYFWWATMLHIQNYVNAPFICVLPTWYLTCDTQYYFLSPLLIYPLWKWPVFGYLILILTFILSVAISFYLAWIHEYSASGLLSNQFLRSDYFIYHYITPHTRASPFIIGIGLGYILFKTKNKKITMNPLTVAMGWLCSISLLLVTILGNRSFQLEERDYNRMESSLFLACTRSAWTLGVAWIIWACRHGYGGPVDYILSFPTYQIIGRLSYAVFLTHMGTQFLMHGASKRPGHFSDFSMIFTFFGDLVLGLALAFLFTLFIEFPLVRAEGLLLKRAIVKKERIEPARQVQVKAKENTV